MSLIDEALKRARAEAVRQDAAQRSAASRWVPSYPLTRRRPRTSLWIGVAAGCLAAGVAVGVGVGMSGFGGRDGGEREEGARRGGAERKEAQVRREGAGPQGLRGDGSASGADGRPGAGTLGEPAGEQAPTADQRQPGPPAPATAPGRAPSPGGQPAPQGTGDRRSGPASSLPSPSSPRPVEPSRPPSASTPPGDIPQTPPAAPQQAAPASPAPGSAPQPLPSTATYVRRASLPDGGALELGGIAFSAAQPVALLNGRVVGVGEVVEGMTVVSIAPGRVDLEGQGTSLALLIK